MIKLLLTSDVTDTTVEVVSFERDEDETLYYPECSRCGEIWKGGKSHDFSEAVQVAEYHLEGHEK